MTDSYHDPVTKEEAREILPILRKLDSNGQALSFRAAIRPINTEPPGATRDR